MRTPQDLGFRSNDLGGRRVVLNVGTRCLGVQTWENRDGCDWGRVYLRVASEERYGLVGSPDAQCSDTELVTCEGPYLLFLRSRGRRVPVGWGFDSESIVRVQLPSRACTLVSLGTLTAHGVFVSELHGGTADGRVVFASIGRQGAEVTYEVARVDLDRGSVEPLLSLPAVFV